MSWEHLQDVWRKVHNKRVRTHFRDIVSDPDSPLWNSFEFDINVPRQSLCLACLQSDNDTADMVILRTLLFWVVLGQASALHPPLYTTPTDRYQQDVRFAPQVTLYFREELEDVEEGFKPIDAEISFRLKNQTPETFSPSEAMTMARKIQREFAIGTPYRWKKGRTKLTYRDKDNGYQFSVNAFSESEGKDVIRKVVGLQNHSLNESLLTISQMAETPPIIPPQEYIYGETRRLPRKRPVGWVNFRYAECHIWGVNKPVTLVDLTLRRSDPLLRDT